ncbi:hypothetical protein COBT_000478 [Conglomerata obtusa]
MTNLTNAKFVNNYTSEKVLEKLTRIDQPLEKRLNIRNRNRYNEIFAIKYQSVNEKGHEEIYNIIKKYLDSYCCLINETEFSIATLQKETRGKNKNSINNLFDFMQKVTRLYLQKDNQEKLQNNAIHIIKSDKNLENVQEYLFGSRMMLINNTLYDDDDFALFYINLCYIYGNFFYENIHYVT